MFMLFANDNVKESIILNNSPVENVEYEKTNREDDPNYIILEFRMMWKK